MSASASDGSEPAPHAPSSIGCGAFAEELRLFFREWRQRWSSNSEALSRKERYICCALGAFTYFFVQLLFPYADFRAGGSSFLFFMFSRQFLLAMLIYVILPTSVFALLTGHSKRPRGRVRLYLDGLLLPIVVTLLIRTIQ